MRKVLRLMIPVSVTVAVLAAASAVSPAMAAKNKDDALNLLVSTLTPMQAGQQGWIGTTWSANVDVCDVEVTGSGPGLDVSYPTNTATFSSFYTNSALAADNLDFVALNLGVPARPGSSIPVTLEVNYRQLPPGQIKKQDDLKTKKVNCAGPKGSMTVDTTLPITPTTGPPVIQVTGVVNVPQRTPTWVNVTFKGNSPGLDDFRVTLAPPPGLQVVYPGDAASSGLNNSPTLPVAREDFASMRLDAAGLPLGLTNVPLHATYTGGSYDGQLAVTVT